MFAIMAKGVPGLQAAAVAMLGLAFMSDTLTTPTAFCRSSCGAGKAGQYKEQGFRL
jgi:hypothetical protein